MSCLLPFVSRAGGGVEGLKHLTFGRFYVWAWLEHGTCHLSSKKSVSMSNRNNPAETSELASF